MKSLNFSALQAQAVSIPIGAAMPKYSGPLEPQFFVPNTFLIRL